MPRQARSARLAGHSKNVIRTDVKATKVANDVAKKIKQEFKKWIFADEARRDKYERRYNNIFNSLVGRNYDGSKLTFPGLNSDFVLRPHQRNCRRKRSHSRQSPESPIRFRS